MPNKQHWPFYTEQYKYIPYVHLQSFLKNVLLQNGANKHYIKWQLWKLKRWCHKFVGGFFVTGIWVSIFLVTRIRGTASIRLLRQPTNQGVGNKTDVLTYHERLPLVFQGWFVSGMSGIVSEWSHLIRAVGVNAFSPCKPLPSLTITKRDETGHPSGQALLLNKTHLRILCNSPCSLDSFSLLPM